MITFITGLVLLCDQKGYTTVRTTTFTKPFTGFLQDTTKKDTTIKVPPTLHEDIHREAADRGISIVDLIRTMFEFFINGGDSHLLSSEDNNKDYAVKERIWREDLKNLVSNKSAFV